MESIWIGQKNRFSLKFKAVNECSFKNYAFMNGPEVEFAECGPWSELNFYLKPK